MPSRRAFLGLLVAAPLLVSAIPAPAASRTMEVWKDPTCGCCKDWISILRKSGFEVTVNDTGNGAARAKAGIARQYGSCHTALIGGYAIEGHVMEQGGRVDPYTVLLLHRDGGSSAYAKYR